MAGLLRGKVTRVFSGRQVWQGTRRRLVGTLWFASWLIVLRAVHRPWEELGGVIPERARWLERLVLGAAFVAGCLVGTVVREKAQGPLVQSHARALRYVWIPPGALAAGVMLFTGDWQRQLLVLVGALAYWAGLDIAVGAWPLLSGRHYAFRTRIERDPTKRSEP